MRQRHERFLWKGGALFTVLLHLFLTDIVPHVSTLGGVEASAQHDGQAAAVGRADVRVLVRRVLQDARAAKQDVALVPLDGQPVAARPQSARSGK